MTILGIGCDIVNIIRISYVYEKYGDKFLHKILTSYEASICCLIKEERERYSYLAKRFAAKEAFGKALGIGVATPATLPNIAVVYDALGKPAFSYAKAMGTGISEGLAFTDIEMRNDNHGRPYIVLVENSASLQRESIDIHLSLSDDYPTAIAYVVISTH